MAISSPEMMLVPVRDVSCVCGMSDQQWIRTQVDITKGTAADLAADTVLVPHAEVLSSVSVYPHAFHMLVCVGGGAYHGRHVCRSLKEEDRPGVCCVEEERDAAVQPFTGLLVVVRVCNRRAVMCCNSSGGGGVVGRGVVVVVCVWLFAACKAGRQPAVSLQ